MNRLGPAATRSLAAERLAQSHGAVGHEIEVDGVPGLQPPEEPVGGDGIGSAEIDDEAEIVVLVPP